MGFRDARRAPIVASALGEARERTLGLVAGIDEADLERVHSPLMSPLVWDLGHIAAFEDLWLCHRLGGRPLLRDDLADGVRRVRDAACGARRRASPAPGGGARLPRGGARRSVAELYRGRPHTTELAELVLRHEQQHGETMLQTIQLAQLAGYVPPGRRAAAPIARRRGPALRPGARRDPGRPVRDRSCAGRLRLRQRAPAPRDRRPPLPTRPHPDHQRHLPDLRRGRRLRAARVVDRRGVGVEGGVRHRATGRVDRGSRRRSGA